MGWFGVLLLFLQAAQPAAMPDAPTGPGVYYRQGDGAWVRLQAAPIAEMKTKGMELFIETGGYTDLGMSIVCRGAKASLRIPVPKPTFLVREVGSPKDLILVRLTQKKDRRTFQASSSSATVENKGGFKKGDIHKMAVVPRPDNSFSVTPEEDLHPGEYLLVFGYATASFDFGIDPEK
jgi:hypothetical protein